MAEELNLIRVALGRVSVYEGLVDVSPTAALVDGLVRDHEELEARIDRAVLVLRGLKDVVQDPVEPVLADALEEVYGALRGEKRVPDSPEGLTED